MSDWFERCHQEAISLTKEQRQEILNLANKGLKLGEIKDKLQVSLACVCGVLNMNIFSKSFLRRESL